MKKTKTGLHIETRKNRIEVYTQKELEQQERDLKNKRHIIILCAVVLLCILSGIFGYLIRF
tara:strand:+ start:610 stop:792 length:183 start_codon:yes stop_codon:yes gene_type:complete